MYCGVIVILLLFLDETWAFRCQSCANDFVVWQWRHLFLKRNYAMSSSDNECTHRDFKPEGYQNCHSSCFILFVNGTDKETGYTKILGVGRGCSSNFLSEEQKQHMGFGYQLRRSQIGDYLPHDFDKFEITEHWCFCATDECNTENCFRYPISSVDYTNYYMNRRLDQYSNGYRWFNSAQPKCLSITFLTLLVYVTSCIL